jgi:hypothetical protein
VPAIYRVRQFFRAAAAWLQPEPEDEIRAHLPPEAAQVFAAMPRYDRQHALQVLRTLEARGYRDPDLLAAALLHDAGKTGRQTGALRLWHRVAVVLMRAFRPGLLERLGEDRPGSWREPFYVQTHHAALGARLARQVGCSAVTVELIQRHEDPPGTSEDIMLQALQAADNLN